MPCGFLPNSLLSLVPATDNAGLDFLSFAGHLSPLVLGLWSTGSGTWAVVSLVPDVGTAPAIKMLNAASRKVCVGVGVIAWGEA